MNTGIDKGDIFLSPHGVKAEVIEIKSDSYYSGDMVQIHLEFLSGLNAGAKIWYDIKTLRELFTKETV